MKVPNFLYFSTPKFVVVKDARVGFLLRAMQAAVFFYVLYDVLQKGSYLETETPVGVSTSWYDEGALRSQTNLESLPYCTNTSKYDFARTEALLYKDFSCIYKRDGLVSKTGNTITFTTNLADDKVFYVRKTSAALCNKDGNIYLNGSQYEGYAAGACIYTRKRHFLPVGVENMKMTFWHSYATSKVGRSGSLPATYIRRKGNTTNLASFPAGKTPSLTVNQWLSYAGINLDKPVNEQDWFKGNKTHIVDTGLRGVGKSAASYPYVRVMGIQILVTINYYNYEMGPGMLKGAKLTEGNVKAIVELEPVIVWSGAGSSVVYMNRQVEDPLHLIVGAPPSKDNNNAVDFASTDLLSNGVVFTLNAGGSLGRFQYRAFINSLVQGSVLLGIAHTIVGFLVMFGLGFGSKLYREFVKEKVNARREYARFAAQSIVAAKVFHDFDKNDTKSLSSNEVYMALTEMLGYKLNEKQRALLTDFIMRHGDEDEDTVKKGIKKGEVIDDIETKLSLEEFINIYTHDNVNFDALEDMMQHEYKDAIVDEDLEKQLNKGVSAKKVDASVKDQSGNV